MKIYIAGKIAGDKRYRAKFREAAKTLEAAGHVVLNPATLPDGLEQADYMRICLAMLDTADLAVFLPDYQESKGGSVAIWPLNPETMEQDGPAEVFGDWQAAEYLARVLEMIHPSRQINVPDLGAMIRQATKDGFNICDYCLDCNCRDCIVNEWKGDLENE